MTNTLKQNTNTLPHYLIGSLKLNKLWAVWCGVLLASVFVHHSHGATIPLFKASYNANFKGLGIKATRALTDIGNNNFELNFHASSWAGTIDETSSFTWQDNNIKPIKYQYHRKILGKTKQHSLTFDWDHNKIISTEKKQSEVIPNTELALDRLSYQLQLQHALLNNPDTLKKLEYKVADRGKIKQYQFEIIGEEQRNTSLGQLNTIKVKVIRNNQARTTYIWFAPEWQYLLVHLEQYENNKKEFEIKLSSAEINGKPLVIQ